MHYIYTSDNAAEAHMISHMLEQHGIMAQVHGEFLQSGAGEITTPNCIKVSVIEDDAKRAKELLDQFETKNPPEPKMRQINRTYKETSSLKNILIFLSGCGVGIMFTFLYLGYTIADIVKLVSGLSI